MNIFNNFGNILNYVYFITLLYKWRNAFQHPCNAKQNQLFDYYYIFINIKYYYKIIILYPIPTIIL